MTVDDRAFAVWVGLVIWMIAKMHGLSVLQLVARQRAGHLRNPEDVAAFKAFGFAKVGVADAGWGARLSHAWRNDVENIPLFLITGLGLVLLGAEGPALTGVLLGYGLFRTVHSVCYAAGLQPWRTLSFFVALSLQAVAAGWLGWLALQG